MPREYVKLVSVSYPAVAPDAEGATIASLMADRVDGNLSDYVIDYVPVRTSVRDGERLCMVAVTRKEDVVGYLDALSYAGLNIEALEVAPLSLRRLIEFTNSSDSIENTLAIDMGYESTHLTLLSGRRLLATQTVDFGAAQLIELVSATLSISSEVAANLLANEGLSGHPHSGREGDVGSAMLEIVKPSFLTLVNAIDRAFLYASSESYGQANKRIRLFGSVGGWPGVAELVSNLTKLPVVLMNAEALPFSTDGHAIGNPCATGLAVAAGLSLWEMPGDD